ncbi:MAG: hypothetical protein AABX49_01810 [Nanoarchaeota archaeon]
MEEKYSERFKLLADQYYELLVKYESLPEQFDNEKEGIASRLGVLENVLIGLISYRDENFIQTNPKVVDITDFLDEVSEQLRGNEP